MSIYFALCVIFASLSFRLTNAAATGLDIGIRTRNAPGNSDIDTHLAVGQRLAALRKREDQFLNTSTTIQRAWTDAVLLLLGKDEEGADSATGSGLEVTCTKCYINGRATAELKYEEVDIDQILNETIASISDKAENLTRTVADLLGDCVGNGTDLYELDCPKLDVSLDMNLSPMPQASMEFRFDELEVFMQLRTVIAAGSSFEVPLFESTAPLGLSLGPDLELGVFFTVDLLLSVDRTLDITSGFHLKLEDGIAFTIDMFGNEPSGIAFNDGQFEFLPVTIGSDGAAFTAILRVGAHAGLQVAVADRDSLLSDGFELADFFDLMGAGIEVAVLANVAELVTDITSTPDDEFCKLPMSQEYSFALGAAAGATVFIGDHTYGPVAETSTPIWYTTMTGLCASEAQTTATAIPFASTQANGRRDDSDMEILSTEITHIGTLCPQSLSGNCPLSQRTTTKYIENRLLTTATAWPETVMDVVSAFEPFGANVQNMTSSSGMPTSFVPPTPTSTTEGGGNSESSGVRCGGDTIVLLRLAGLVAVAALVM